MLLSVMRSSARVAKLVPSCRAMSFWRKDPFTDMRSMIQQLEEQAHHFESMMKHSKLPSVNSMIPSSISNVFSGDWTNSNSDSLRKKMGVSRRGDDDGEFCIEVDITDIPPENVKVSLKSRVLTIDAKVEEERNGMKWRREVYQELTVPDDVDVEKLSSCLENDGQTLRIEAPRARSEPKRIEISRDGSVDDSSKQAS
ncbi:unnamed protein product [Notodromas monacha]|uniref:SHSP domain-containing protein n=1 Tax=Notodromas monacha TaxID=399045 RepID=A0A7R9BNF5_9CRUS|nr:unnamed protein product [Notodromas monacha]CAG0918408.1 unnamed protein product [Notodromas monacha]